MAGGAESVADNVAFVLVAYILAFGIWTAASGNDFINSSWKSVRKTRHRGQWHVILVFVPMIYMSAYIYFQYQFGDYKEMSAAILALFFAVLHLVRTIAGLWQLHIFRQWTIESVKSLESLGFKTDLPVCDTDENEVSIVQNEHLSEEIGQNFASGCGTDVSDKSAAESSSDEGNSLGNFAEIEKTSSIDHASSATYSRSGNSGRPKFDTQQDRIESQADEIEVNDTLIDNRLSEVSTRCTMRFLSQADKIILKRESSSWKRLMCAAWFGLRGIYRCIRICLSLTFCNGPRLPNSENGPRLLPRHAETVSIHWITALVAQANWMQSLSEDSLVTDPHASAEYVYHRNLFAEQILLNAALHCRRANVSDSCGSQPVIDFDDSFLSFRDWVKYPQLCRGKFSKEEFLRRACRTGCGLPYNAPHLKAVEEQGGVKRYGYGKFESEIRRGREALPADIEARVNNFNAAAMEWFVIAVSVSKWFPTLDMVHKDDPWKADANKEESSSADHSEPENNIPMENLRKQLGFSDQSHFSLTRFKFPLLRNLSKMTLWGNRNVLEVSCHIDNWLALHAGEQVSYMVKNVPWIAENCLLGSKSPKNNIKRAGRSPRSEDVLTNNFDLERCKFLCQMAILKPEDAHLDKSMTFLGCSMEVLRSSLAKWTENAGTADEWMWTPPIPTCETSDRTGNPSVLFQASGVLTSFLRRLKCISQLSER